jgi:hypothetical protein
MRFGLPRHNQPPTISEQTTFASISELLLSVDARLKEAEVESSRSLAAHDEDGYAASQARQTAILADLGEEVEHFRISGGVVPEHIYEVALHYSASAQEAQREGRAYNRGVIVPLGAKVGDPTVLGILANTAAETPHAASLSH